MSTVFDENALAKLGIEHVLLVAQYEKGEEMLLPTPSANEFCIICNAGAPKEFRLNGSAYGLGTGDVLFLDSDYTFSSPRCPAENGTLWYAVILRNENGLLDLDDNQRELAFFHAYRHVTIHSKNRSLLIPRFADLFTKRVFPRNQLIAALTLLLGDVITHCRYERVNGADWTVQKRASALSVRLENTGGVPFGLIVEINCLDLSYTSSRIRLIGDDGTVLHFEGSHFITVPPHFSGWVLLPLRNSTYLLSPDGCIPASDEVFRSVQRLIFHFCSSDSEEFCPAVNTEARIGAFTLVDEDNGFVRSLSYATNYPERSLLSREHSTLIFNKQYYRDNGMELTFDTGFRLRQVRPSAHRPFLCTVMGATKNAAAPVDSSIERAVEYIHTHYAEKLNIDLLSHETFLSPSRFKTVFRRAVGMSPMRYAEYVRIRQACTRLGQCDVSVTALGYELGYSSPSHFAASFRRQTGITPAQYRKSLFHR